jgi:hypothetical protein
MAQYWKSILAFLSLFVTNLAADWMANGQPWPEDWTSLARWVLTIGVGTWLVWQKANAPGPHEDHVHVAGDSSP